MRRKRTNSTATQRFLFFLICGSLIILLGSIVWRFFAAGKWDGKSRITVVIYQTKIDKTIQNAPIGVFSIEPAWQRAIYLLIDSDVMLNVPYGYQNYLASSVYALGELDPKRGGGKLLSKAVQNTLRVHTDGHVVLKENILSSLPKDGQQLVEFKRINFSLLSLVRSLGYLLMHHTSIDRDVSLVDLFRLWFSIRRLRTDQIVFADISKSTVVSDSKLADGNMVKMIDPQLLDLIIADSFTDSQIRKSSLTMDVVNATDYLGLASLVGDMLEHMGVHVVGHSNAAAKQKAACVMYLSENAFAQRVLIGKLRDYFLCSTQKQTLVDANADIQMVLGDAFLQL